MHESPFGRYTPAVRGSMEFFDATSLIAERVPEFAEALWAVTYEQAALVSQVLHDREIHESVRLLFSLSVNDFSDLLSDLREGSGRSAVRAARSVIEHAINMHTIASSEVDARRYAEHLDQGPALALGLKVGASRLEGPVRRSYVRALAKVGQSAQRRFESAVGEHGSWFRRGWVQANLKDRADAHGLDHIYQFYKLASLVTHGSAGGSLGTIRDDKEGLRTFRTGPALELAPVAMWAGIAGYREVLSGLAKSQTKVDVAPYLGGLERLDSLWAAYYTTIKDLDEMLWPKEATRPPTAVLAFTQSGKRRWFLHLPIAAVLLRAHDPSLPESVEEQVSSLIEHVTTNQPGMFRNDQRWVTAAMLHVSVTPDGTGRWIPDTALMEVPQDGWEPRVLGRLGESLEQ